MREAPSIELQECVKDFLKNIGVLPRWIDSSAADRPGRGHYEWGNWSDAIRAAQMWDLGGPWRTIIADIRSRRLLTSVTNFHKLKDQIIWEIVEQAYLRAERNRSSPAADDIVKTRIRSVFSWQRRHDLKKNSLMWFLDFAFVLDAYSAFQGHMLFSSSPIPREKPAEMAPLFSPAEFGIESAKLEDIMIDHNFLPFYCHVEGLEDKDTLAARRLAKEFCSQCILPTVDMDTEVRETRGMPREDKAVDFMTPWLESMSFPEHDQRWNRLVRGILTRTDGIEKQKIFKTEVCRAIVVMMLLELSRSDTREAGYVYDIAASTAVEQSEKERLVLQKLPGHKRKRTISRRTLRGDLDTRIERYNTTRSYSGHFEGGPSFIPDPGANRSNRYPE